MLPVQINFLIKIFITRDVKREKNVSENLGYKFMTSLENLVEVSLETSKRYLVSSLKKLYDSYITSCQTT